MDKVLIEKYRTYLQEFVNKDAVFYVCAICYRWDYFSRDCDEKEREKLLKHAIKIYGKQEKELKALIKKSIEEKKYRDDFLTCKEFLK